MPSANTPHRVSDAAIYVVARPLMFVLWMLVLWGTLYGGALLYAVVREGSWEALRRAVSGRDAAAGVVSLIATGVALVVWSLVAVVVWNHRARVKRTRPLLADGRENEGPVPE